MRTRSRNASFIRTSNMIWLYFRPADARSNVVARLRRSPGARRSTSDPACNGLGSRARLPT